MKTRVLAGMMIIGLLSACGRAVQGTAKEAAPPAPPLPEDVASVAAVAGPNAGSGLSEAAAVASGTVTTTGELLSPMRSEVTARIVGRVSRVMVDEGARVKRGQPLLGLETEYLQLEADRAGAELRRATAALDEARREYERKKQLSDKGSVPTAVFDRARAAFEQATAAEQGASSALALTRQRLGDAVLVSPIDGIVVERRADVGERLGDGGIAYVIEQDSPLKLRFRLPERNLASLTTGLSVRASVDPYPGEVFEGKVTVVGLAVDPQSRSLMVEAEIGNDDLRLRPGLFARVELDLSAAATAGPETGEKSLAEAR